MSATDRRDAADRRDVIDRRDAADRRAATDRGDVLESRDAADRPDAADPRDVLESRDAADRRDVIAVLSGDHRAVEDLFRRLETGAAGLGGTRKSLVDAVALELAWHCTGSQRYLVPLARRALADGDTLADQHTAEHLTVEHMVRDLEAKDPSDARFEPLLAQLMAAARGHIEHEEQITFAELTRECDRGELLAAGEELTAARRRAASAAAVLSAPATTVGPTASTRPAALPAPARPAASAPSIVDRIRAMLSET